MERERETKIETQTRENDAKDVGDDAASTTDAFVATHGAFVDAASALIVVDEVVVPFATPADHSDVVVAFVALALKPRENISSP